jgi:hypothetical protein
MCRDHLRLGKRCYAAGSDLRRYGQSVNRIVERRRKAGNGPDPELRTTPIDQVNAAITIGGRVFYKLAQGSKNVGEWATRGYHFQESLLAGELSLGPLSIFDNQLKVEFAGAQGLLGALQSHGDIVPACSPFRSRFHERRMRPSGS